MKIIKCYIESGGLREKQTVALFIFLYGEDCQKKRVSYFGL